MRNLVARNSAWTFAAVSLTLVAIKLLFQFYPGDYPIRSQAQAFSWPLVAAIIVIGLLGLLADHAARLPEPFADRVRDRQGLRLSTVTGALYGLVTIALYIWHPVNSPLSSAGWEHVLLPWSIPFYTFGAIFLEYLLRLGALCILFWLLHVVIFRRRFRRTIFWLLAAIVALYEIWPYLVPDFHAGRWDSIALSALEPLYLSNVFEAWLLYRFGWFMPIVFRLAFYLVWHILFGGLAGPYFGH
ncbi:MAG TPA: hypothetical protein VII56_17800 [Rhizomicrobium sp.]